MRPSDATNRGDGRPGSFAAAIDRRARAKAQRELGWKVKFPDIDSIVATAWKWHSTHPNGYGDRKR